MYVSDLQPGSLKPCGHDDNGVILLLQTLSVLKSYMKEIARYVDSASQQGSGGIRRRDLAESRTVTPDLAVHPPAGGQLVQVLWLSTAYVLESKIPTEWRNVTSNYRIRSFNVQAREVRRLAAAAACCSARMGYMCTILVFATVPERRRESTSRVQLTRKRSRKQILSRGPGIPGIVTNCNAAA